MPAYEAMRWALGRLNQDSGTINGEDIVDSYIPGVKIGKSSARKRASSTQLSLNLYYNNRIECVIRAACALVSGMYVEDSCEMPDIATRSVSDLYPQLYYSKDDCSNTNNNQLSLGEWNIARQLPIEKTHPFILLSDTV